MAINGGAADRRKDSAWERRKRRDPLIAQALGELMPGFARTVVVDSKRDQIQGIDREVYCEGRRRPLLVDDKIIRETKVRFNDNLIIELRHTRWESGDSQKVGDGWLYKDSRCHYVLYYYTKSLVVVVARFDQLAKALRNREDRLTLVSPSENKRGGYGLSVYWTQNGIAPICDLERWGVGIKTYKAQQSFI